MDPQVRLLLEVAYEAFENGKCTLFLVRIATQRLITHSFEI